MGLFLCQPDVHCDDAAADRDEQPGPWDVMSMDQSMHDARDDQDEEQDDDEEEQDKE